METFVYSYKRWDKKVIKKYENRKRHSFCDKIDRFIRESVYP